MVRNSHMFLQTYPQRDTCMLDMILTDSHFNDHMTAHTESSSAETNTSHWMSMARNRTFPLIA